MRQLVSLIRVMAFVGAIACTTFLASFPATATTAGFDDLLGVGSETAPIIAGYADLTGNNFTALDTIIYTADLGSNGYGDGVVSGRTLTYSGVAAEFSESGSFLLFSYSVRTARDKKLTLLVQGWHAGILVASDVFAVSAGSSVRRVQAWANIDTVTFSAAGDTSADYRGHGPEYYVYDIQIEKTATAHDAMIPESSGIWLFAAAIGAFLLLRLGGVRPAVDPEEHL